MIALFLLLVIVAIVLGIVGVVEKGRRDGGRAGRAAILERGLSPASSTRGSGCHLTARVGRAATALSRTARHGATNLARHFPQPFGSYLAISHPVTGVDAGPMIQAVQF